MSQAPARIYTLSKAEPPEAGGTAEQSSGNFDALLGAVRDRQPVIAQSLLEMGAVLFKGTMARTTAQFAELVQALSGQDHLIAYKGGASPREPLAADGRPIYNSTEYPAEIELPLHNELSYSDDYPARIYFCCLVPPAAGGETTLGDSRRILAAMPPDIRGRLEKAGVRYVRHLASGKGSGYSWQDAFRTEERMIAERKCEASGAEWQWLPDGHLRLMQTRPAVAVHPQTREEVWFNQVDGFHPSALDPRTYAENIRMLGSEERFRLNVYYGDGSPIAAATLEAIRTILRNEVRLHAWQRGDVLMLDNLLSAHGRRSFRGPRRIAVAMT